MLVIYLFIYLFILYIDLFIFREKEKCPTLHLNDDLRLKYINVDCIIYSPLPPSPQK